MAKPISVKQIKKGLLMSISAQIISLTVSLVLNLIVPKFVDEYQYAYWQTYMLYVSYVGILHFGILDGIVLRYSQYDYEELDKPIIRSQFLVLFLIDSIITFLSIGIASLYFEGITKQIVILVALGIVTRNIFTYTSYTFQITNRINRYAYLVIGQRLFYGMGVLVVLFSNRQSFVLLCAIDLLADVFGILLGSRYNKGLYFGSIPNINTIISETKLNIASGILLLIANWASNLLVGSAKMVVQWKWDAIVFGKISFAFSVSNLFLTFVTAISIVLFPSLKRIDEELLPGLYNKIRSAISPLLFSVMILYFPGCYFLRLWLPNYRQSLLYLGFLLPLIVFASKVSLLTNNYLKAYRKEQMMLFVNVFSLIFGIVVYLICAYLLNNLKALLIGIVLVIMVRSIISESIVAKTVKLNLNIEFIIEFVMTIVFILSATVFKPVLGCLMYALSIVIYIWIHFNDYRSFIPFLNKNGPLNE